MIFAYRDFEGTNQVVVFVRRASPRLPHSAFSDPDRPSMPWRSHRLHIALSNGPTAAPEHGDAARRSSSNMSSARRGDWLTIVGTSATPAPPPVRCEDHDAASPSSSLTPAGRAAAFQRPDVLLLDKNASSTSPSIWRVRRLPGHALGRPSTWTPTSRPPGTWAHQLHQGACSGQVCYYVATWLRVAEEGRRASSKVSLVVPQVTSATCAPPASPASGIAAGHPRRRHQGTASSTEFFRTGVYRPRSSADTLATSSRPWTSPRPRTSSASSSPAGTPTATPPVPSSTGPGPRQLLRPVRHARVRRPARHTASQHLLACRPPRQNRAHGRKAATSSTRTADGVRRPRCARRSRSPLVVMEPRCPSSSPDTIARPPATSRRARALKASKAAKSASARNSAEDLKALIRERVPRHTRFSFTRRELSPHLRTRAVAWAGPEPRYASGGARSLASPSPPGEVDAIHLL